MKFNRDYGVIFLTIVGVLILAFLVFSITSQDSDTEIEELEIRNVELREQIKDLQALPSMSGMMNYIINIGDHPLVKRYSLWSSEHGIRFTIDFEDPIQYGELINVEEISFGVETYSELYTTLEGVLKKLND